MLSALGWGREDRPRQNSKTAGSAFPALSPMVVMKNVLVKQVRGTTISCRLCTGMFPSFLRALPLPICPGEILEVDRQCHTDAHFCPGETMFPFNY